MSLKQRPKNDSRVWAEKSLSRGTSYRSMKFKLMAASVARRMEEEEDSGALHRDQLIGDLEIMVKMLRRYQ